MNPLHGASDLDRFQLFTMGSRLAVSCSVAGDEAERMGLTPNRVCAVAADRLRAAQLYRSLMGLPKLHVDIRTHDKGPAFLVALRLKKWVRDDDVTGLEMGHSTWEDLYYGTHGQDAGFIMQRLAEMLDGFILEYLRVNEDYC